MSLVKGFFALFPKIKKSAKVTSHPGSELPPHPSSWTAAAQLEDSVEWVRLKDDNSGKPNTGTDALGRLPGSHRLASGLCGLAKGMRREGSITGTGIRVSLRLSSLLFLLGEEQYRQPRAVYKYWARMKFFHSFVPGSHCLVLVLPEVYRFMDFSGRRLLVFRIQFSLVRQWIHVGRQFMRLFGRISHISTCSTRSTPSTSCVCHPSLALVCVWTWQTQSRAGEVHWDVRVHSSSCGAHLGVVHSPFGRLYHRCHCICRDRVLYVGRLP